MNGAGSERAPWAPLTRIAFRFSFLYLGLYSVATPVLGSLILVPGLRFPGLGPLPPMRQITTRVAEAVFGLTPPFDFSGSNGETAVFWVQAAWLLAVAAAGAAIWSYLDRSRPGYPSLHFAFRLFLRLLLAAQMFEYGITKIIPNQFESPSLIVLLTPAGDLSLNTLLWTTVGASPGYQLLTGIVELLGGLLLLVPRTALAGVLISAGALVHVWVLNMTFDVGLKLTTLHLLLLAAFLLAPDARRLGATILGTGVTGPRDFARGRAAMLLPLIAGVWLVGVQTWLNVGYWQAVGGGAPRSGLYGIWDVERLELDGVVGPAALNDYDRRWRRVIFDERGSLVFQRTDDSFARYGADLDMDSGTLRLTKGESRTWSAVFRFERPTAEVLRLEGEMDGYRIRLETRRLGFDTFRLLNSGFRWFR